MEKNQINIDMVIQNVSSDGKTTDITYCKRDDLDKSLEILKNKQIRYKNLSFKSNDQNFNSRAGMVTTPGITYKCLELWQKKK